MDVNVSTQDGVSIVTVGGRVDSSVTPQLQAEIDPLLEMSEPRIVMDLHAVDYMSSSGVRILVSTLKALQGDNEGFHLANISDMMRGLLLSVGMLDLFNVYDSVDEAVNSFKGDSS